MRIYEHRMMSHLNNPIPIHHRIDHHSITDSMFRNPHPKRVEQRLNKPKEKKSLPMIFAVLIPSTNFINRSKT